MDEAQSRAEWVQAAVARHGPALIRYAATITGDEDTARDVVQDTFVRLCHETPERLDGHLVEWLFTVCRHRALDMQRQTRRLTPLQDEAYSIEPGPGPTPADAAEHQDTMSITLNLLRQLPPRQQEVIRLKFQAGLSYDEISRITHLSVTNVGFILHTALKTLRQKLQRAL